MAEQLVCAVDQVNFQCSAPALHYKVGGTLTPFTLASDWCTYQTMDEFRVSPASGNLPYGEGPSHSASRKHNRRAKEAAPEQAEDDVVLSGEAGSDEEVQDYFVPSHPDSESE